MDDLITGKRRAASLLIVFITAYSIVATAGLHWMHPIEGWSLFFGGAGMAVGLVSDEVINSAALKASLKFCYSMYILALVILTVAIYLFLKIGDAEGPASGHQWSVSLSVFLGLMSIVIVIAAPFGNYKCWDERRHQKPERERPNDSE